MVKRAAIYDPYLDTLGGGERYCLTVAEILLKNGYQVDLFWSGDQDLIQKATQRFSLNLDGLNLVNDVFQIKPKNIDLISDQQHLSKLINRSLSTKKITQRISNFVSKFKATKNYDLFFYLGDGSIPLLFAKKNFLHVQVPFVNNNALSKKLINKTKLLLFSKIICNSIFTSTFYQDLPSSKIKVLYPPVDVDKFTVSDKKEKIILSVGRFDNILNAKKQDILIDAFKKMSQEGITDWKLYLVGGSLSQPDQNSYLKYLQEKAQDLPIEFMVNPSFDQLKDIYAKSTIYWHAAGFGVDQELQPQNTEHFGMTVVEAMASGLVPVVIAKGGIPEIISDAVDGYLWTTVDELVFKTKSLISSSSDIDKMSKEAMIKCQQFSKSNFEVQLLNLLKN